MMDKFIYEINNNNLEYLNNICTYREVNMIDECSVMYSIDNKIIIEDIKSKKQLIFKKHNSEVKKIKKVE